MITLLYARDQKNRPSNELSAKNLHQKKRSKTVPTTGKNMTLLYWDCQGTFFVEKGGTITDTHNESKFDSWKTEWQGKSQRLLQKKPLSIEAT